MYLKLSCTKFFQLSWVEYREQQCVSLPQIVERILDNTSAIAKGSCQSGDLIAVVVARRMRPEFYFANCLPPGYSASLELDLRGTHCDLATKVDGKIQGLIEVKAVGTELKRTSVKWRMRKCRRC
jgi:hypothetical protein